MSPEASGSSRAFEPPLRNLSVELIVADAGRIPVKGPDFDINPACGDIDGEIALVAAAAPIIIGRQLNPLTTVHGEPRVGGCSAAPTAISSVDAQPSPLTFKPVIIPVILSLEGGEECVG